MEMFAKDSDYEWRPVDTVATSWTRYTVMSGESAKNRNSRRLRQVVFDALDKIAPDVLVVNGWGHRESRHSLDWCRKRGCRIVLLSDSVEENIPRRRWKEAIKRHVIRGARAGFAAGRPQARYLAKLGVPRANIFHPGSCVVDNAYWNHATEEVRKKPAHRGKMGLPERYLLCVCRFLPVKNLPFVIDAYARYAASHDNPTHLVLCGSGDEEPGIRERIAKHNLASVHLPGFRQVDELPYYYAFADGFILASSQFECWGLVINEAMASGLPVLVSSQVGAAEDLVYNGVNGYIFDPRSVDELADCIRHISESDERRRLMGANSRRIVEDHSLSVGAANLWRSVEAATERKGART